MMIDLSTLPISGGLIVGGLAWAGVSAFVLGPIVSDRTILNSGWHSSCETVLRRSVAERKPERQTRPRISCEQTVGILGPLGQDFCRNGGGNMIDLLNIDPLAGQKEAARQREIERLERIADQAPGRCSCAASIVAAERVTWGLSAGSARTLGGPDDLQAELAEALHAPRCKRFGEVAQ